MNRSDSYRGSCFHDTDDLPLRLATGVFNLVCALHAAADVSEVESDRGLRDCLVTIVERLFILSGRHPPPGNTREKKSGRQSVAENPLAHAEDRIACNDHFTLLKRFSATLLAVGDARSGHGQSRPSPDAGEWRRAAGPNGMGPNVHTVEESGRCQHLSSLGTDFRASMRLGSSPLSGVESTPLPTTLGDERRESYQRIWRAVRRLQAAMPTCQAARASASKEPAGIA